jgi:hypothetical protein
MQAALADEYLEVCCGPLKKVILFRGAPQHRRLAGR